MFVFYDYHRVGSNSNTIDAIYGPGTAKYMKKGGYFTNYSTHITRRNINVGNFADTKGISLIP
jgi:hypothetical protein